ncbi:hypothetical protein JL722_69 [Aureococcus anophagefferens]|nr:hypothetical protein JL722_69 [Aureococcus anophagefferens]
MRRLLALVVASAAALAPPTKPVKPFHVHVGGGKLGLSLVVPAVAASGVKFSVVDTPKDPAWAALAKGSEFPVRVNGQEICRLTAVGDAGDAPGGKLVLSDDEATLAALVAQATTLSCLGGHGHGRRLRRRPRVDGSRVTADGVAVTAEAWPGAIVPLDAAVNRASAPPFGSKFGAEILAPRSSAAARYLSDRKLNLVNGMHTTLAFATIRDAHAVVPGDLHLAKPSSAGIITRELWHWALARCAILVREHGLDTIKEVHGLDDDDAAFDALTAYARQALERFQLTDDTVARVLGGGVAKRWNGRLAVAESNFRRAVASEDPDAGRIDIIVRQVFSAERRVPKDTAFAPPPDTSLAATLGNAEKKRVFGQEAAFDDKVEINPSGWGKCRSNYDQDNVLATFSFRYVAIEGLQIAKTNPKAWQDWQWHQIEAARVASRELRKSLRGGFALCGTAGLAGYVEHAVIEELVTCERFPRERADRCSEDDFQRQQDFYFDDEYGHLFRSAKSPIKTAKEWLELVEARRAQSEHGTLAENQIYDDDLARSNDPPPLVPFDHVLVRAAQGSDVDYEAVVLAAGSTDTEVRVKEVGSARTETLSRNSKRLGAGLASRRGAAVAEMQVEIFAQAFSNVSSASCAPCPPGRRVLINGIAVAHLGGAFDSIERHNEIIEIQSGDESDEDDAPPAPAPPPRKKSRTSKFAKVKADPGAVKSERRA